MHKLHWQETPSSVFFPFVKEFFLFCSFNVSLCVTTLQFFSADLLGFNIFNLNVAGNSFTEPCYFVAKSIIDWSTSIWVTTHIKRTLVYDDRQAKARILTSWNYLPFYSLRLLFLFTFFHLFTINFKFLLFKKLTAGVRELTYFCKFCSRFINYEEISHYVLYNLQSQLIIYHRIIWEKLTESGERTPKVTVNFDEVILLLLLLWLMSKIVGPYYCFYLKTVRMKHLKSQWYINNLTPTSKRRRKDTQVRQRVFQVNQKLVRPMK